MTAAAGSRAGGAPGSDAGGGGTGAPAAGLVLATLCASQFLMTLDSSVMNVSIAQVAQDLGTDVTGVQTAITLYTLVMATAMITGGKIGTMIGRRRAFSIGCVVYGAGSLVTALAPNVAVLVLGWSLLEGLGAALIMPAVVALVATNFPREARPRAYGLVAAAGAVAVAVGPLVGGAVTTLWTWRWVFVGEVVLVVLILATARRVRDAPVGERARLDVVGIALSSTGLGLAVYGVLRSADWGWVLPRPGGAALLGLSPTLWFVLVGLVVVRVFLLWEVRRREGGHEPLLDTTMFANRQLRGGLIMFFFQFLLQAGAFFTIPLYLSVVLGLSALQTGVRILPLSLALLVAALLVPRLWPKASPRRVVALGVVLLLVGIVALLGGLEVGSGPEVVTVPLLVLGLGMGALASQLGAVTVSALPDEMSGDVGGVQNTATNLGASLGTALAGSVLIGALTASFLAGIEGNPAVPRSVVSAAQVELAAGVPFVSDAQLDDALAAAAVPEATAQAVVEANTAARIDALRTSLAALALLAVVALYVTRLLPRTPVGAAEAPAADAQPAES